MILPEYQGIGLGGKFLEFIAQYFTKKGFDFSIRTSARNLVGHMKSSDKWILTGYTKNSGTTNKKSKIEYKRKSARADTRTYSFFFNKN